MSLIVFDPAYYFKKY